MPALNPLTFLLTWSGRQLETYTQGNKTIEFEYDENGLRHRKTVKENGVIIERYDYVWSEGTLVSQTYSTYSNGVLDSTNSAKFIYDAWGTLQGFVLNDTATYLYTKNLQGDILSIVNESGQTIVTYEYNSWGAVSFSATSMQNMLLTYTLSFVSPFTYRGYCYDYDIELYYLQSRYYSAEIGRFINTDDTQIAIATQGTVLGANLFAYCENNPVVNVDYSGYITLKQAVSRFKELIRSLSNYIKNKLLSLKNIFYSYDKKKQILEIKTGPISTIIDALIAAITRSIIYSGLKKGMKALLQVKKIRDSFIGMIFDFFLTDRLGKGILWVILQVGYLIIGKAGVLGTLAGDAIKSYLWKLANFESKIIKRSFSLISAFSSIGGFVALFVDLMDGIWDDKFTVKIKR